MYLCDDLYYNNTFYGNNVDVLLKDICYVFNAYFIDTMKRLSSNI